MKHLSLLLAQCLMLFGASALADACPICAGDTICDTCGGLGYLSMQAYGSDEIVRVACTADCDNGRCPDCAVPCDTCGSDGLCNVCGGDGKVDCTQCGGDGKVEY